MNREQQIKEARTIEAMKNGYMGMEGKFALIAKRLGQPIIQQGSRSFSQNFLPDPFDLPDENTLPTLTEDDNSYEIGLIFDGLTRGANMSVIVHFHNREIICEYEGRKVYKEANGELEGYAPDSLWETKIESFYNVAKKIEKNLKPTERQKMIDEANKKRKEILDDYKNRWGL
jgi:hypothetical protein